jgi:hypothetical protein
MPQPDLTSQYNTPLNAQEMADYNTKFKPNDAYDYDMQGWYKANPGANPNDKGVHYPDTFKKPNHPTFSNQSQYHGQDGNFGGAWNKQDNGSYTFQPGATNLNNFTPEQMQDYFSKVEPDNKLQLPSMPGVPMSQLAPDGNHYVQNSNGQWLQVQNA